MLLSLTYKYIVSGVVLNTSIIVSALGEFVLNLGCHLALRFSKSQRCRLERAIMIDRRKKQKTLSYL